ncbi:MAG TPA: PDZ domain-containing protein [Candidatus Acidoferrales bacterium]|nr:PDZ domain-containing protein [Candidatus Acidoferrales bacterium]
MKRLLVLTGVSLLASTICAAAQTTLPFTAATPYATQSSPLTLSVDASLAARGVAFVHEVVPAKPGMLTLVYPKWIPGEHGPTGPLSNLTSIVVKADGKTLEWRRDTVHLYQFHVDVPTGADALDVDFTVLMNGPGDQMSTHNVAVVNWNRFILYQNGVNSHDYYVKPSIVLPQGWDFGTALRDPQRSGNTVTFALTPLNMLVDSPLDMGSDVKKWTLWQGDGSYVELDAFAAKPQDLDVPAKVVAAYKRMPAEAFALYGSRHFADYHALLTLDDGIGFQGIEHHQSSDDRAPDDFLTNPGWALVGGDLVTHEFSHSWNGKYRRPADLTTPNFQVPQQTDLLWVYEGMNQYLGDLLSFRCGIRDPKDYPEYFASIYANMDTETGRDTTPIIDLTAGAPYYYVARGDYHAIRRGSGDFYEEGELIWLDVDTIIRERSHGARSLDTFLHLYSEPAVTGPITKTYDRAQIEALLDQTQPYDWHAFFQKYVYSIAPHPPTDEIERSGWRLVYNDKPNTFISAGERLRHSINAWYSIGAQIASKDGRVTDVRENSPAWQAGLAVGETIEAVDGQAFDPDSLDYALKHAENGGPAITLLVSQTGWYSTLTVNYHDGPRYPHLERIPNTPDMLYEIMKPHAV